MVYDRAGVSGPTEFGELPPADRLFWRERVKKELEEMNDQT